MALVTFNDNIKLNAPKHIDTRYLNLFTPYVSTAAANAAIPSAYRYLGLTVLIGITEYWYQSSTLDAGLIAKIGGVTAITANNGVNMSTLTNVQLGGAIIQNTLLDTTGGDFKIYINGASNTVSPFVVTNSLNAPAILGQATSGAGGVAVKGVTSTGGIALYGQATNGIGVYGTVTVTAGIGLYSLATASGSIGASINATGGAQPLYSSSDALPSYFNIAAASTNTVLPVIQLVRQTQSNGANNIGGSIEFYLQKTAAGIAISNQIISEFPTATNGSQTSQLRFTGVNAGATVDKLTIGSAVTNVLATRFAEAKGADIASANNLTLGTDGNLFHVTGSVQINAITIANWQAGSRITLIFNTSVLVKNNTAGGGGTAVLILAGATDFSANANDTLTLAYDGTSWFELTRKTTISGGVYTFRNGLTESPATFVGLGGTLISNTTIDPSTFSLSITGSASALSLLTVSNTNVGAAASSFSAASLGANNAISATSNTGDTIIGTSTSGAGISGISSSGLGGHFSTTTGAIALQIDTNPASTNTIVNVLTLNRNSSGTGATGIGASISYGLETTTTNSQLSNSIVSKWTDATHATRTSQLIFQGVNAGTTVDKLYIGGNAIQVIATRLETALGANVASANNLTLGTDGNIFTITGVTQINAITIADWQAGSQIGLLFQGVVTVKNNTAGGGGTAVIFLQGSLDYVSAANDYLTLMYDGTAWREIGRRSSSILGTYTFTSGLTEAPAGTVKLGGAITQNTTIDGTTGNRTLTITSAVSGGTNPVLIVTNTSATSGLAASFTTTPSTTNTVIPVITSIRNTSGTGANGIGQSIDLYLQTSTTSRISNQIISQLTNATDANRTSQLSITGLNNAVTTTVLVLNGDGTSNLINTNTLTRTGTTSNTVVDGYIAQNNTAATNANQQYGPAYYSNGKYFSTTSRTGAFRWYNLVSGATGGHNQLTFEHSLNGGAFVQLFTMADFGTTSLVDFTGPNINATNNITAGNNSTASNSMSCFTGYGAFGGFRLGYQEKTATYTAAVVDHYINCTANTFTVNLPAVLTVGNDGNASFTYQILNSGNGVITVQPNGAETIKIGNAGVVTSVTLSPGQSISLVANLNTPTHGWQATAYGTPSGGTNLVSANNGLTANTATNVQLGGTLIQATNIAQAGFNFSTTGTGNIMFGTNVDSGQKLQVIGFSKFVNAVDDLTPQMIFYAADGTTNIGMIRFTANANVFIGKSDAGQSVTGQFNIGIGAGALNQITTGQRNIAIGIGALQNNGANNVNNSIVIGNDSLDNNGFAIGDANIVIGHNSYDIGVGVIGSANIFIGTGSNNTNGTNPGSSNIVIGHISDIGNISNTNIFGNLNGLGAFVTLSNVNIIGTNVQNTILGKSVATLADSGDRLQVYNGSARIQQNPATTNTVITSLTLERLTTGTAASLMGQSIDFYLESASGTSRFAHQIRSQWSTATDATRSSNFVISNVLGAATQDVFQIGATGGVILAKYGAGAMLGAAVKTLSVTSGGFIIEGPVAVSTANNALSLSATTVQLGGTFIQNTVIDHASLFQLSFINTPVISIGTSTVQTDRILNVTDTSSSLNYLAFFNKTMALSNTTNIITTENFLQATGTTFTGTLAGSHTDAMEGQLWMNYSSTVALEGSVSTSYSGVYGAVIRAGAANYTGNVLAGGYFGGYAASTGNASDVAGIIVQGLQSCPAAFGAAYSGTVTNYYGILVNSVAASSLASSCTNKYGIYIKGTALSGVSNVAESAFTTPSDRRLKTNIKTSSYGLKEIEQLSTTEFTWTEDIAGTSREIGFVAQDVETVLPEAVKKKGLYGYDDLRLLDKEVIFSVMVNAIKELSAQNKVLTDEVNILKTK